MFIKYLFTDPRMFFSAGLIVVLSICCHEYMHALAALKNGDPTAADNGHLTLNPLKQMGWFSLILLAVLGIAWGQVPVNPANFRRRSSALRIALAGPLTNLVLALCLVVLCALLLAGGVEDFRALRMIFYGSVLNLVLFFLNMFPVPGFAGSSVVQYFFPGFLRFKSEAATIVMVVLVLLLFSCIRYLFAFAEFLGITVLKFLVELLQ